MEEPMAVSAMGAEEKEHAQKLIRRKHVMGSSDAKEEGRAFR